MRKANFFTIHKYIVFEFVFSFIVAFLFFFFIFFVNQLLLLAEDILSKDVSLKNVLLIILYSIPAITSFTFPFASLVGGLMSVSRLSSDNEILAFQASGIRYAGIFYPLFIAGLFLSVFSFMVNDYFLPLSTVKFGQLYREILYSTPELELDSFSIKKYQDSTIITGKVQGNTINHLVIIDRTSHKDKRVISAANARLVPSAIQQGISSMELRDVFSVTPSKNQRGKFNYFYSENMIYNILLKNITFSIKTLTPREMSSADIYKGILSKKKKQLEKKEEHRNKINNFKARLMEEYIRYINNPADSEVIKSMYNKIIALKNKDFFDRNLQIYELELNKKLSITFACLIFVFFAFPVSLFSRKSGRSVGFGIGLLVSVFYWGLLFAGQTLGIRMNISPFFAMWTPNIVIFLSGLLLMMKRLKR